ncbi:MAG: diacylglycerol kinase family protein [Candidatus Saccharibacteria bacterium]|nr:diacylglycerol kinase family protein [Candidatus Saccharibacteria bacterium]
MKRIFLVYNPNSSQYRRVKTDILEKTDEFKGYVLGKYAIKKTSFEKNVAELSKILENDDLIISAGGDATAAIAANAILKSKKDVTLSVLPYGNFNDLARTLNTKTLSDALSNTTKTKKLYPLSVYVDGKFWRHATCYVTIGMTGEAVEIFDDEKIRKTLQKGHKSSWRSYRDLAMWYFKNRHSKIFLPNLILNGKKQPKKTSDYAAVNGRSMCRVMRGGDDFLYPKRFMSLTGTLANLFHLTILMTKSIIKKVPAEKTNGDLLEFTVPTTIEIQAEGEYKVFENVQKIEIKKDSDPIKVILKEK